MTLPLESVPNFSEGRDPVAIESIGAALSAHAKLLDVHTDVDHNRSVFTLVGDEEALLESSEPGDTWADREYEATPDPAAPPRDSRLEQAQPGAPQGGASPSTTATWRIDDGSVPADRPRRGSFPPRRDDRDERVGTDSTPNNT